MPSLAKRSRAKPAGQKIRVLLAKIGLDGHDRGIKIVAQALRDAGIEVVYLGVHNTPEEISRAAIQEDVDAIGVSVHSAAHITLFRELLSDLEKHRAEAIAVFGGGIIPDDDIRALRKLGVSGLFTPGAQMEEIVRFVKSLPPRRIGRRGPRA